jgi:NADPH:quinone reductase-like Zn-dependent oxidoreductase
MSMAMAFAAPGPPEVLQPTEVDPPRPGPGEVLVRVRAAGVQPADLALRAGQGRPGVPVPLPAIPGNELAGVVVATGPGVARPARGDAVLGFRTMGAYAELALLPVDQLVAKPPDMAWAVAGALSASGQTAHTAIEALGMGPGETVLISGAAGGVGTVAVQLAAGRGARVIATASERNHAYLRSLGPEGRVVPTTYRPGLVERVRGLAPEGVDVALDAAGGDAARASAELVGDRARVGTLVAFDLAEELGIRALRSDRSAARLAELVRLWSAGELRIQVSATFPLERAADAHRLVGTGHGRGKVVLLAG